MLAELRRYFIFWDNYYKKLTKMARQVENNFENRKTQADQVHEQLVLDKRAVAAKLPPNLLSLKENLKNTRK